MDKKTAGLVGAISALTPLAATAAPAAKTLAEVMAPTSYAELLQPIPNAVELLKEAATAAPEPQARVEQAQYYGNPYYNPYYYRPRGTPYQWHGDIVCRPDHRLDAPCHRRNRSAP
jgi:hypothetical protein